MIETMPRLAPETVTPLRPSEALRLGRLTRPVRIEGTYLDDAHGACAIGAMAEGLQSCPAAGCRQFGTVMHLNDDHHWSDDQMVAWLESLGR